MSYLVTIALSVLTAFGLFSTLEHNEQSAPQYEDTADMAVGADIVLPIAGQTYTLAGSGVASSDTSFTLTSFTITQNGKKIQDSEMSDTFYVTFEPGNRARQEIASCTTVTQNADGTATISGCTRGLAPITPYTASTTLQFSHSGGSAVIFSDPPQLFNQAAFKDNDEVITGQWTFNNFPITPSTTLASASTTGISELATGQEAASSTRTGDTGPLILPARIATSSYSTTSVSVIPVTRTDGTLAPGFVASSTNFSVTGTTTFAGGLVGAGGHILYASTTATTSTGVGTSTAYSVSIPGNTLRTDGGIIVEGTISDYDSDGANRPPTIQMLYGGTLVSSLVVGTHATQDVANALGSFRFYLIGNNSASSQFAAGSMTVTDHINLESAGSSGTGSASIDSTTAQTLLIRSARDSANDSITISSLIVTTLK